MSSTEGPRPVPRAGFAGVDRFHSLLRQRIREAGFTLRSVSRKLGWHEDYASQLFRGTPRLRVDQAFELLGAAGIDPAGFFADLARALGGTAVPEADRGAERARDEPALDLDRVLTLVDARIEAALERAGAGTDERRRVEGESA